MTFDLDNINKVADRFARDLERGKVYAFYGSMGAGKTTFIRALCQALGVDDMVTSPTFAIINEYTSADGTPIYHFDFYRIRSLEEVEQLGYEDYFYGNGICFVEWPELIEPLLPSNCVKIKIEEQTPSVRRLTTIT